MKFSVIMPVYLGEYKSAATDRETKFKRAIQSVLLQEFQDFELIIVCDGCEASFSIVEKNFSDERITAVMIPKQKPFSGAVRNSGIVRAIGEYIVYLDSDDVYGKEHLRVINEQLKDHQWVWFNDHILSKQNTFVERNCHANVKGRIGTSNVCHKREMNVFWRYNGYAVDDFGFVSDLRAICRGIKIETPKYCVCHIPKKTIHHYDI